MNCLCFKPKELCLFGTPHVLRFNWKVSRGVSAKNCDKIESRKVALMDSNKFARIHPSKVAKCEDKLSGGV